MKRIWLTSALLYSSAGLFSSAIVGFALGTIGKLLISPNAILPSLLFVCVVGVVAFAREARLISLPLPQLKRQTPEALRLFLPLPTAAGIWGFDLGLVFTTWVTYAGPWFLAAVALASRSGILAAALFVAHWIARASWVWAAPYLLTSPTAMPSLADAIDDGKRLFAFIQALGLMLGLLTVAEWVVHLPS